MLWLNFILDLKTIFPLFSGWYCITMSLKQNKIKTKDRIESQHDTEALIQEQPECQLMLFQFSGSRIEAQTWQFRENFV